MSEKKIELDVKPDEKSLREFLLYHNYFRPSGILGIVISLAAVVLFVVRFDAWTNIQRGMLVFLALLFTVIQPLMLLWKAKKQLAMPQMQEAFHYAFDKEGVEVSQGGESEKCQWKTIRKIVYRPHAIYVFTSTVHAFVLPKAQCGGQFETLVQCMKEWR